MNPEAGTTRGAGVDFVATPDGTFVLEKSVGDRRAICLRLITQFAAGYLAERRFFGDIYEARIDAPDGDQSDILNKAVWGIATPEDNDVIEGTAPFETWAKRPNVEALIAEGERLSSQFLNDLESAVNEIAEIAMRVRGVSGRDLHIIVEKGMKEKGIGKFVSATL